MAYVKITNGSVDTYPYNVGQLRRDNPTTSFPKAIPEEMLNSYGVYSVTFEETPEYNYRTQYVIQNSEPSLVNSTWTLGFTIKDKTVEQINEYDDSVALSNREKRNVLLTESDWTQAADAPVDSAVWKTYRQALRDITNHANFPHLNEEDWPVKPA